MTFTRTKSGLRNYSHFFGSEIIIYAEGRCGTDTPIEDETRADTKFYLSIAKEFSGYKEIKVKLVGNKKNALDYHKKILDDSTPASLVFVDRDYQGLVFFPQPEHQPKLLTTYGYSWENDFWTTELCKRTVSLATALDKNAEDSFERKHQRTINRLKKICALNAAAHTDGKSVFPCTGNSKGVNLDLTCEFPLRRSEFVRICKRIPISSMCEVMKWTLLSALKMQYHAIIQGHLLEHICLTLISDQIRKSTGTTFKGNDILKNIALSSFMATPRQYLTAAAINHYTAEFSRTQEHAG